jgi:hypothetical protein
LLYFFFQTTYFLIPKVFFPLSLIHPGQAWWGNLVLRHETVQQSHERRVFQNQN